MKTEDSSYKASQGVGRVMEIVLYLVGEMRRNKQLAEIDLHKLADRGYTESEVSTAFTWLVDKIMIVGAQAELNPFSGHKSLDTTGRSPFRVYHELELAILQPDARGYLLQLRELGLLKDAELELLLDRLWLIGAQNVSLDETRDLAANIIFDFNDSSRLGSRMMLALTDRVQ